MMKLLITAVFVFTALIAYTQTETPPENKKDRHFLKELVEPDSLSGGVVHIQGDPRIGQLMELEISVNKKEHTFSGYRIQILSATSYTSNVDSLQRYCENFEKTFPDIPAYLQYFDPDFKIRVGNFKTKIEAIPVLKKVRKKYPLSYIVKTSINLKELLKTPEEEENKEETPIP